MASIILFKDTHFGGDWVKLFNAVSNLKNIGFNDVVSSVIVCDGAWTMFKDTDFKGTAWTVNANGGPKGDGVYPSYSDWGGQNDVISSLRPST